jgi:dienelactone hydrolase
MPVGSGPFPAIVLVHGSGVVDRDATIGPNRIFRDLAGGLATRGVAVLRYEKRTRQYGPKLGSLREFTVKEETVDDAAAAVEMLRKTDGIDAARVFVLGHSLGGMLAPRIAGAAPEAAGFIVLAGAVRSLPQSLIDQTRYLALADGEISAEEQRQIEQFEQLKARVETVKSSDPPLTAGIISAPAAYWANLRGYDPPAAAKAVKRPMLVLQGERDYQVTLEDFQQWKAALGARGDVTLKSYPALNHLFMAGAGKSLPAEYAVAGHVAVDVIDDIARWVAGH